MIASLPMYDWPEAVGWQTAFWRALAERLRAGGIDAPDRLARPSGLDAHWRDPALLFSQTCGYPYATRLRETLTLLGTPHYDIEGCASGSYSSAVVVRADDRADGLGALRAKPFAFNGRDSLSGWRCLSPLVGDPADHFGTCIQSGAHRASAQLVAQGRADVAALDALCWHMLQTVEPQTAGLLRVLQWTPQLPALPFVTSAHRSKREIEILRAGLGETVRALPFDPLVPLTGIADCDDADYAPLAAL